MTPRSATQLRDDARTIWQAGVNAVRSDRLVRQSVLLDDNQLTIAGERFDLTAVRRIVVIGAGKAGAGMAAGLEAALGPRVLQEKRVTGWMNVPADCVGPLECIHLHPARPAGVNEPTPEGEAGAQEIMRLVAELEPQDLCIALISGGGSALLPLPIEGVTLADKLAVTRFLSAAGAPIDELNTVRKQLSRIKGGGLARACGAGQLVTLIISDVLGDPLDLIASGPTVEDPSSPADALAILERYAAHETGKSARETGISQRVFAALQRQEHGPPNPPRCHVSNHIIGNNAVAVTAADRQATLLGYLPRSSSANASEGAAESIGRQLAAEAKSMLAAGEFDCLISGGEPTVKLIDSSQRGRGGRNQQLVLAAIAELYDVELYDAERCAAGDNAAKTADALSPQSGIVILSGGTDGEDGPTDAAGAWADAEMYEAARSRSLDPHDFLRRNDAYHWFEPLGGLLITGPTHTNVCDLRVVLVARGMRQDAAG